jgi:hypothetical protein
MVKLLRAHGGCLGTSKAMKDVESCDKLTVRSTSSIDPSDFRMGEP